MCFYLKNSMSTTKLKKIKFKTHKASSKRFRVTATGLLMHLPQGGGNGHSRNYKNRRQRAAAKNINALRSNKQSKTIRTSIGA